jgi:hypothetical protein
MTFEVGKHQMMVGLLALAENEACVLVSFGYVVYFRSQAALVAIFTHPRWLRARLAIA